MKEKIQSVMSMPVKFSGTEIPGVLEVETGIAGDQRGSFSEAYCRQEWETAGFTETFVQDNLSVSTRGTMRGIHYQLAPYGIGKLVRVPAGSVFDVAVDLREGSPTFGKWVSRVLSAENRLALWIPVGFGHGMLALEDDTLLWYKCTAGYVPEAERVMYYNDAEIGIEWPIEPTVISSRDAAAPGLQEAEYNFTFEG